MEHWPNAANGARARSGLTAFAVAAALLLLAGAALGQPKPSAVPEPGPYLHWMLFEDLGDSIRFNNPYRLETQLGSTGESLSRTPLYNNLGGGLTLGKPNGLQHGLMVQWSRALSGLPQHVVTPSYVLLHGGLRPWVPYGRVGVPIILNPDANAGAEAAVGASYLVLAGIGVHAELVGDLFYGAATWTSGRTTIPMLSLQIGVTLDYEVLP
jgi:hypothetical protein